MSIRLALIVIFIAVLFSAVGPVYGQPEDSVELKPLPGQNIERPSGNQASETLPASGRAEQPGQEVEVEQPAAGPEEDSSAGYASVVGLNDGLLSVGLTNAPFGKVMSEIANRAGFELYMSNGVYEKSVTTKFEDVELERGILRLLGLISQKTYFLYYNADGSYKKLEIFGLGPGESPRQKPAPTPRPARRPSRQTIMPGQPQQVERSFPGPSPRMPARPPTGRRSPYSPPPSSSEEPAFIPPREAPVYIPPSPQGRQ